MNDLLVGDGGEGFDDQNVSLLRWQPVNSSVVVGKTVVHHFEHLTLVSLAVNIRMI